MLVWVVPGPWPVAILVGASNPNRRASKPVRCGTRARGAPSAPCNHPAMPRTVRSAILGLAVIASAAAPAAGATIWSAPHPLSNCGAPPDLTLARDGSATARFANDSDCGGESGTITVLQETRPAGLDWSAPTPIAQTFAFDTGPAPAGSPADDSTAGARVVAWSTGGEIHAAVRDHAGAWGADQILASGRDASAGRPVVAIGDSGDAVVAWVWSDWAVEAAVRAPDGRWSAPVRIVGGPRPVGSLSVSIDATGRAVVVWLRRVGGVPGGGQLSAVLAAEHARGAVGWTVPVTLAPKANAYIVRSGVDGAGTVVAAWWSDVPPRVVVTTRSPGGVWRRPAAIPGALGPIDDLAVGPLGDIVVSTGDSGFTGGFQLTTRAAGGPWRTEPIDANLNGGRVLVNGAGDSLALSSSDPSDTQEGVYVSAGDQDADRPAIRTFRALGTGSGGSAIRLRLALSKPAASSSRSLERRARRRRRRHGDRRRAGSGDPGPRPGRPRDAPPRRLPHQRRYRRALPRPRAPGNLAERAACLNLRPAAVAPNPFGEWHVGALALPQEGSPAAS